MKCHVELACWVMTDTPVSTGDVDRLAQTFMTYLNSCGGLPEMAYHVAGNSVCITGFSVPGKDKGLIIKAMYVRKLIIEALQEAGMEVPEK